MASRFPSENEDYDNDRIATYAIERACTRKILSDVEHLIVAIKTILNELQVPYIHQDASQSLPIYHANFAADYEYKRKKYGCMTAEAIVNKMLELSSDSTKALIFMLRKSESENEIHVYYRWIE